MVPVVGAVTWERSFKSVDYKLELNAFYRVGDNGQYDGSEEVYAELYMNDFTTPVQNLGGDSNNFTDEAPATASGCRCSSSSRRQ